ncbi:hypothetical protein LJC59_07225 [Desulfovibrio sp. OttesenSCG-928-A18]|nr:hypothetical protein [Desulfovibrio sp. OttesenSCG-928-A18]
MTMTCKLLRAACLFLLLCAGVARAAGSEGIFVTLPQGGKSAALTAEEIASGKEAEFSVEGPQPMSVTLRRNSPNGVSILVLAGDLGWNLAYELPQGMHGFGEYGELEAQFTLEAALGSFGGRTVLFIASGDRTALLSVALFVYAPGKDRLFAPAGLIQGQRRIEARADGEIHAPYGSQGLFERYRLEDSVSVRKIE